MAEPEFIHRQSDFRLCPLVTTFCHLLVLWDPTQKTQETNDVDGCKISEQKFQNRINTQISDVSKNLISSALSALVHAKIRFPCGSKMIVSGN